MEPGAHIHDTDPFADPDPARSPVRRLRGRLVSPVTLWTAPGPVGLTVSSVLVVDGDPGRVLGLLDPESDLWPAVSARRRFAVTVLAAGAEQLADRFAGLLPAPGGPFRTGAWEQTDYGPVPADPPAWAGCRLDGARPYGWGLLVEGTVERVGFGPGDPVPLAHHRGRYRRLSG
jgi:flavin reductase (DIM6/NTAB) family NADH-FMN oxidoreductase RutF